MDTEENSHVDKLIEGVSYDVEMAYVFGQGILGDNAECQWYRHQIGHNSRGNLDSRWVAVGENHYINF